MSADEDPLITEFRTLPGPYAGHDRDCPAGLLMTTDGSKTRRQLRPGTSFTSTLTAHAQRYVLNVLRCAALTGGLLTGIAHAQSIACPATATPSGAVGASAAQHPVKALPLANAGILVSRWGDPLSEDIPATAADLERIGIVAFFPLPTNPDVVVMQCRYGDRRHAVTVALNVPKSAKFCWVKRQAGLATKSSRNPTGHDVEARCDVALPTE